METAFLPVTREEMLERGWDRVDFAFVSGDAYVDHPSFGMALITRLLEANGYKVGVIAQPDWNDPQSIAVFGEPRLGFFVSSGNMDSMVNHYTVAKKRRRSDAYSPGGEAGKRPNHAAVVYGNLIRRTYKKTPLILGGIEASLRRLAHYDYWSDKLKRSILLDSGADLVSYGMGEHSVIEIADALNAGLAIEDLTFIDGTVFRASSLEHVYDAETLPSFPALQADKLDYARSFAVQYRNSDPFTGKRLVEPYSDHEFVVQNPPAAPLTESEMDAVYRLPYARTYHPMYEQAGGVPAISEVKFSLTSNRGCFGECSFCALTFHQGRIVQVRSHDSLVEEAQAIIEEPDFKGYIHDVGGPTANFRAPACAKQLKAGACPNKRCLYPEPCKQLNADHGDYLGLLRRLRKLPGVKKVFVRSGIRFDFALADEEHGDAFLRELCAYHVSGQLRVAPEHVSDAVLSVMGKPRNRALHARQRAAGQEAVPRAVPHVVASRLHARRGHRAGGVLPRPRLHARAGAGLLSHALHDVHGHVLHRRGPAHHAAGVRAEEPARESAAARAHPVPRSEEPRARAGGAAPRRTHGPGGVRADVPAATPGAGRRQGQGQGRGWREAPGRCEAENRCEAPSWCEAPALVPDEAPGRALGRWRFRRPSRKK